MLNFNQESSADRMSVIEREARGAFREARCFEDTDVKDFLSVVGPDLVVDEVFNNPALRAKVLANCFSQYKAQRPQEFRRSPNFRDRNVDPEKALRQYAEDERRHASRAPSKVADFRDPAVNPEKELERYKRSLL